MRRRPIPVFILLRSIVLCMVVRLSSVLPSCLFDGPVQTFAARMELMDTLK